MSHAPWAIVKIGLAITLLEVVIFWVIFQWVYGERIEMLRERIQTRDDQIEKLKAQLTESLKDKNEVQSQPYTIRKEDEVDFIQTLASSGQYDVHIEHLGGNDKSLTLAQRLASILESSGWNIRSFDTAIIGGRPPTGVIIRADKENGTPRGAALLQALLTKRDIETQIQGYSPGEGSPRLLKIFVGPDPRDFARR